MSDKPGISQEFKKLGAAVCVIDRLPNPYFVGDLSNQETLEEFVSKAISEFGRVDHLMNNAMITNGGISTCSYDEFNEVLRVGITAPFYLAKLFLSHFSKGASIVNISSSRDRMSQPDTE